MRALRRAWDSRGLAAWLLRPAALLYGAVAALHRGLYRLGVLKRDKVPVPVIVVGNVVTGGAGKTPVVIAIVHHLLSRGLRPGVISRGYGRTSNDLMEVRHGSPPADVGDEPVLIHQSTGAPVFVAARRAACAQALLAAHPDVNVLVSDDGLQHHALQRDIDICVFDERGIGNGWLLPAGPLRETWPRAGGLHPPDLVLRPEGLDGIAGHTIRRGLAQQARRADGTRVALQAIRGTIHAVAGIARPEAFFRMLANNGIAPSRTTALPDHDDLTSLETAADETVVCTEKDAVKLWRTRPDALAVPLQLDIAPEFWSGLDRLLDAKLSSRHGSQTA